MGVCGVPEPGAAFSISANPNATTPGDFLIGGGAGNLGRAYVDGILCQFDAPTTYLTQPDLPDPPAIAMPGDGSDLEAVVYLEVWHRLITVLEDDVLREVALAGPDTTVRLKTVAQVRVAVVPQTSPPTLLTCGTAGQFLPQPGGGTLTTLQPQFIQPAELCQLPDPNNFTGRQNSLYRVEIHEGGDPLGSTVISVQVQLAQDAAAGATVLFLAQSQALAAPQIDAVTRWGVITISDDSERSEKAEIAGVGNDGQSITLTHGLTNAFATANNARVHGVARFKWARNNASFAVRVTAVSLDRRTLTLSSLGRDQATMLRQGDLVEISNDVSELGPARGHLTNLQSDPDPDQLTVVIADPLPADPLQSPPIDLHMVLRRWDGQGTAQAAFGPTDTPYLDLGDGVHIQFGGTNLLPGDYWQFTARSIDGSVEALTNARPSGIVRQRCPLAVVVWSRHPPGSPPSSPPGAYSLLRIDDCRKVFPPLVDVPRTRAGLHIQQVFTVNQTTSPPQVGLLVNDGTVLVSSIVSGINVLCDANVDPASITRPTCFLSVETPAAASVPGSPPTSLMVGYNRVIVASNVSAVGTTITWLPTKDAAQWLSQIALATPASDHGILARFTLKGNFIWTATDPPLFLDGTAFGLTQNGGTALSLPSGDNRPGGDFEMWFWLIAQPVALLSLALSQTSLFQGDTATGTITLSAPATAGLLVQLASSAPGVATVPPAIAVNTGFTSASFPITGTPTGQGQTTITVTLAGVSRQAPLTVSARPVTVVNLVIAPSIISQGAATTGIVTLSGAAPAGSSISLNSSNPAIAAVPLSIAASGATTVNVTITTAAVGTAVITATFGNSFTATVSVVKTKEKEKEKEKEKRI